MVKVLSEPDKYLYILHKTTFAYAQNSRTIRKIKLDKHSVMGVQ